MNALSQDLRYGWIPARIAAHVDPMTGPRAD